MCFDESSQTRKEQTKLLAIVLEFRVSGAFVLIEVGFWRHEKVDKALGEHGLCFSGLGGV